MPIFTDLATVQALIPELKISATSKPTTDEATAIINRVEAEIKTFMTTEVLDVIPEGLTPDGEQLLEYYASIGSVIQIWAAGFGASVMPDKITAYREDYQRFLTRLEKGSYNLIVEGVTGTESGLSGGALVFEDVPVE